MDIEEPNDSSFPDDSGSTPNFLDDLKEIATNFIGLFNGLSTFYLLLSPLDNSNEKILPVDAFVLLIIMLSCSVFEFGMSSFAWWRSEEANRENLIGELIEDAIQLVNSILHFILIGLLGIGLYNIWPLTVIHILAKLKIEKSKFMVALLVPPIRKKDWAFPIHLCNALSAVGLLSSTLRRYGIEPKSAKLQKFYLAVMMFAFSGLEFAMMSVIAWRRERINREQLKVEFFDHGFMLFISLLHFIFIGLLGFRVFYMSPLTILFILVKNEVAKPHIIVAYLIKPICNAYKIVLKHKKQAFQAFLLALEVISFVVDDLNAKGKKGFHIALLCLSLLGFAWTIVPPLIACYATKRLRPRSQIRCMELFLSLFQLITAIPPVFGYGFHFDLMKLLPLIFAITNVVYGLNKEGDIGQAPSRCVSCLYNLKERRRLVV